jgi:hypothetical protein
MGILNAGPTSELFFYNENVEVVWQNSGGILNAGTSTVVFTIHQKISVKAFLIHINIIIILVFSLTSVSK